MNIARDYHKTVSYIDLLNYKIIIYALCMHVHTNNVVISQSNSIANNKSTLP